VAYIEALVGAAPYFRTTDPRMKLDARFAKALSEFNKQDDLRFDQYVARKLRTWFARRRPPPPPRRPGPSPPAAPPPAPRAPPPPPPPGRAARGGLGRGMRNRKMRRPMPCLEANKSC